VRALDAERRQRGDFAALTGGQENTDRPDHRDTTSSRYDIIAIRRRSANSRASWSSITNRPANDLADAIRILEHLFRGGPDGGCFC
jgi:hypothetical protein